MRGPSWKKDSKYSESQRRYCTTARPTAKISIQSLRQIEIEKVIAADANAKLKKYCVPNFRQRW
jgi:hypothetical protein